MATKPLKRDEWDVYFVRWLQSVMEKQDCGEVGRVIIEKIDALLEENKQLKELLSDVFETLGASGSPAYSRLEPIVLEALK